jgi:hypothetical protein
MFIDSLTFRVRGIYKECTRRLWSLHVLNLYVVILNPKVLDLGGSLLGCDSEALLNGISSFINYTPES